MFLFNSIHFYFYKHEILLLTIDKSVREPCILQFQRPSKSCQDECCGDAPEAVPGLRHQPPDSAEGLQQGAGRQADTGQPAQRE